MSTLSKGFLPLDGSEAMTGNLGIRTTPLVAVHALGDGSNSIVAYFSSETPSNSSTRVGINHASNAGFGLYIADALKWSIACYGASRDFTFWNDMISEEAILISGASNLISLNNVLMKANKMIQLSNETQAPAASATHRGKYRLVHGGAGVADLLYCCMKSAADTYSWVQIATG